MNTQYFKFQLAGFESVEFPKNVAINFIALSLRNHFLFRIGEVCLVKRGLVVSYLQTRRYVHNCYSKSGSVILHRSFSWHFRDSPAGESKRIDWIDVSLNWSFLFSFMLVIVRVLFIRFAHCKLHLLLFESKLLCYEWETGDN